MEKSEGREEGEPIALYYSDKCSDKVPGSNREKIFLSQSEVFKDILEEIAPIPQHGGLDVKTVEQRKR